MAVRVGGNVADDVRHVLQINEVEACGRAVRSRSTPSVAWRTNQNVCWYIVGWMIVQRRAES